MYAGCTICLYVCTSLFQNPPYKSTRLFICSTRFWSGWLILLFSAPSAQKKNKRMYVYMYIYLAFFPPAFCGGSSFEEFRFGISDVPPRSLFCFAIIALAFTWHSLDFRHPFCLPWPIGEWIVWFIMINALELCVRHLRLRWKWRWCLKAPGDAKCHRSWPKQFAATARWPKMTVCLVWLVAFVCLVIFSLSMGMWVSVWLWLWMWMWVCFVSSVCHQKFHQIVFRRFRGFGAAFQEIFRPARAACIRTDSAISSLPLWTIFTWLIASGQAILYRTVPYCTELCWTVYWLTKWPAIGSVLLAKFLFGMEQPPQNPSHLAAISIFAGKRCSHFNLRFGHHKI